MKMRGDLFMTRVSQDTFLYKALICTYFKIVVYKILQPGHTKCVCDACFDNIRQLFRRCDEDTVSQLAQVINKSAQINVAQVCQNDPNFN